MDDAVKSASKKWRLQFVPFGTFKNKVGGKFLYLEKLVRQACDM
jgi:hypothetical protein